MIGLLQRVTHAQVDINGDCVGRIDTGLLVLVGVERDDDSGNAKRLAERLCSYRVFPDEAGRMNLNIGEAQGGFLLVPQFTLAADTGKGNRPGFSRAAAPEAGAKLFAELVAAVREAGFHPATGRFGADMQVSLCNDGPVTFWLQC